MLYYLNLYWFGDGDGDGDGTTCYETTIQTTGDGITPYQHKSAPYPLNAVDLLTRLAATKALQPATTTGEHHGIR